MLIRWTLVCWRSHPQGGGRGRASGLALKQTVIKEGNAPSRWRLCPGQAVQAPAHGRASRHRPNLLHRVAEMAAGGMDTLPHCGATITLLAICKLTHWQSYLNIATVTMLFPLMALVMVIRYAARSVSF